MGKLIQMKSNNENIYPVTEKLEVIETITSFSRTGSATFENSGSITIESNKNKSIVKIYGVVGLSTTNGTGTISFQTSLRPKTTQTIKGRLIRTISAGASIVNFLLTEYTINTNGVISFNYTYSTGVTNGSRFSFIASDIYL